MSRKFSRGQWAVVTDKTDTNEGREGVVVREDDNSRFAELQFETGKTVYHDNQLDWPVIERPGLTERQLQELPSVPYVDIVKKPDNS